MITIKEWEDYLNKMNVPDEEKAKSMLLFQQLLQKKSNLEKNQIRLQNELKKDLN